jgi:hypothetical protein
VHPTSPYLSDNLDGGWCDRLAVIFVWCLWCSTVFLGVLALFVANILFRTHCKHLLLCCYDSVTTRLSLAESRERVSFRRLSIGSKSVFFSFGYHCCSTSSETFSGLQMLRLLQSRLSEKGHSHRLHRALKLRMLTQPRPYIGQHPQIGAR